MLENLLNINKIWANNSKTTENYTVVSNVNFLIEAKKKVL